MSTLGLNIACEAKKYIGIMEQPLGSNTGPQLVPIFQKYFANQWDKQGKAYCTIWAWVVVDDVTRRMGGANRLPNYAQTWGNARNTMEKAKSALTVDNVPAIGSVFYRYSWSSSGTPEPPGSGGSSGHMGIVVDVLPDGTLLTVEANQGSTNGILPFSYTKAQYTDPKYGFAFIHTELVSVVSTTLDCPPTTGGGTVTTVIPTTRTTGTPVTGGATTPTGASTTTTTTTATPTGGTKSPTSSGSATGQPVKVQIRPCDWNIPIGGRTPHYSKLQELRFASDVIGGNNTGGYSKKDRNGYAVGRRSDNDQESGYSGVGMVTDRNGKLIVITNEDNERWTLLRAKSKTEPGLLGQDYWNIRIGRHVGDGWKEKETEVLAGKREFSGGKKKIYVPWNGQYVDFRNMQELLQYIEQNGPRGDTRPIALTYVANPIIIGDVVRFIVDTALPFALDVLHIEMSGVTKQIFDTARKVVSNLAAGRNVSFQDIASLAKMITPSQYWQYVDAGAQAADQVRNGNALAAAATLGLQIPTVKDAAADLSVAVSKLLSPGSEPMQRVETLLQNVGTTFTSVQGRIQGALNSRMLTDVHRVVQTWTSEIQSGVSDGMLSKIPRLRMFWTAAASSGTLAPMVPHAQFLMNELVNRGSDFEKLTTDLHRGFSFVGMGFPSVPETFQEMALLALKSEADKLLRSGEKKMILPASIPQEKRDCFAKEISETGITVIDKATPVAAPVSAPVIPAAGTTLVQIPFDLSKQTQKAVQTFGTPLSLPTVTKTQTGTVTVLSPSPGTPSIPVKLSLTPEGGQILTPVAPTVNAPPVTASPTIETPKVNLPIDIVPTPTTYIPTPTPYIPGPTVVPVAPPTPVVKPSVIPITVTPPTGEPRVSVAPPVVSPVYTPPAPVYSPPQPVVTAPTTPYSPPQPVVTAPATPYTPPEQVVSPPVERSRAPTPPQQAQPPVQPPLSVSPPVQAPQQKSGNCYPGFAPGTPIVFTMPLKPAGDCGCGGGCGGGCDDDDCGCHGLADNGKRKRSIYKGF